MSSSRSPNPQKPRTTDPSSQISPPKVIPTTGYSKNRTTGPEFYDYCQLNLAPERYVQFSDFGDYNLEEIFEKCGLNKFLGTRLKNDEVFHEIIAMFYANLQREGNKNKIVTNIHRVQVIITLRELGEILELPYSGMRLEEVEIENDKYKENCKVQLSFQS